MAAIEPGKICVKIAGREAGQRCVIVDVIDKNYVLITGPPSVNKVRRRRSNIKHLEATENKIEIKRGAEDNEIVEALKKAGLLDLMKEKVKISL
ncbi:MAG: 50S ribosomal protein L14e [Candidatus Jordarchaeaceae archaeon]